MNRSIFVFLFSLGCLAWGAQPTLLNYLHMTLWIEYDDVRKLDTSISEAKLMTSGKGTTERTKDFTWWRKLSTDKVHYNTLTRFHFPPEVRGEGILFLEHANGEDDIQLYLPNFKKIRRVETDQQSESFMGSEFSYSDITAVHVDDHTYSMVRVEDCPHSKVKCWVISSTPISDQVKEQTGSIGGLVWIRQDNFMLAHGEYKDLEGKPWKVLDSENDEEVDKVKHKWMALKLKMENLKTTHITELEFKNVKVNQAMADSIFSVENLSREK